MEGLTKVFTDGRIIKREYVEECMLGQLRNWSIDSLSDCVWKRRGLDVDQAGKLNP